MRVADFTSYSHDRNIIVTCAVQYLAMDMDALHSALLSITLVSEKLGAAHQTVSELNTEFVPGLADLLGEAERDLRMTKATLAGELGFDMCPRCWPPEIVTTDARGRINCPNCGEIKYERAA